MDLNALKIKRHLKAGDKNTAKKKSLRRD
jgi:hypothetical protein